MKIKCMVVDDEPLARKGLLEYIGMVNFLETAGIFENALDVYPALQSVQPDLMFLDIAMPGISGIDLVKSLSKPPLIIFTTAYPEFALEGFELDVTDYLVKPILLPRFLKAVNKAKDILSWRGPGKQHPSDHFFVKENGRFTKVMYDEILYAEALQNYVAIHLHKRKLIAYITLSVLENQLPPDMFLRIHKSYIVSLNRIDSIEGSTVLIQATALPISRNIKDQLVQKVLENKLLKR